MSPAPMSCPGSPAKAVALAHRRRASHSCGDFQYRSLLLYFAFCRYILPSLGRDNLVQHCLLNALGLVLLHVVLQNGAAALLWDPQRLRESCLAPSTPRSSCSPSSETQPLS